jgi:hypothetical protein
MKTGCGVKDGKSVEKNFEWKISLHTVFVTSLMHVASQLRESWLVAQ